jgi:hypothetical protein
MMNFTADIFNIFCCKSASHSLAQVAVAGQHVPFECGHHEVLGQEQVHLQVVPPAVFGEDHAHVQGDHSPFSNFLPWDFSALLPWDFSALLPWDFSALLPWDLSALPPWDFSVLLPWAFAALLLR